MILTCAAELRMLLGRIPARIISGSHVGRIAAAGNSQTRQIAVSSKNFLKEILVQEDGDKIVVEGVYKESPRAPLLVKTGYEDSSVCPLCALNLNLKHTDVLILSQFLRKDGCLLPSRVTGLCAKQQRRVSLLVAMSQKAGLMPNLAPAWSKKDPKKRYRSKKYNRYFDESTLEVKSCRR
ncbi:large ribosomal subunit protein mL66 [Panulirus ornatus]|uniref:large ribosomal subunit protein mL66 n=1 Tax=Panulirus ornatus TaxID=150431 RepID=UPI003A87F274